MDIRNSGSRHCAARPTGHHQTRKPLARLCRIVALGAVIGFAGILTLGCSKGAGTGDGQGKGGPRGGGGSDAAVPVSVGTVTQEDIPVTVSTFGTVEPYATVAVKPQVTGKLLEVHVTEGQYVKQGDLLFVIDPQPYQAALNVAQANLEKDTAQAAFAQAEFARTGELLKGGIGSPSDYDKDKAAATSAQASVNADKAAIETAKLNLDYCHIASPVDGRTGRLLIDRGNIVTANDVPIITINQVKPIAVAFALPEQDLARVRELAADKALDVEVSVPGGEDRPERGKLTFIDNSVASDSGTIALKAIFQNSDERLWPGQHVNVTLLLSTISGALVVPTAAVQESQAGKYAFILKSDMTVENRPLVAGDTYDDKTVIKEGLALGETVITEGHLRLVPGAKATVKPSIAEGSAVGAQRPADKAAAAPESQAGLESAGSTESSTGNAK